MLKYIVTGVTRCIYIHQPIQVELTLLSKKYTTGLGYFLGSSSRTIEIVI